MTNIEKLRTMNSEKLAYILAALVVSALTDDNRVAPTARAVKDSLNTMATQYMEWLEQETII